MNPHALIAIGVTMAACGAGMSETAQVGRTITIHDERGGSISAYIDRANAYRAAGVPVVISGNCHSACAVLASLPTACLGPRARLGLHWPVLLANGHVLGQDIDSPWFDHVTPQIAASVRARPFDSARALDKEQVTVTPRNAAQYGLRACEAHNV